MCGHREPCQQAIEKGSKDSAQRTTFLRGNPQQQPGTQARQPIAEPVTEQCDESHVNPGNDDQMIGPGCSEQRPALGTDLLLIPQYQRQNNAGMGQLLHGIQQLRAQVKLQAQASLSPDGSYKLQNQQTMRLREGECLDPEGNMYMTEAQFRQQAQLRLQAMAQDHFMFQNGVMLRVQNRQQSQINAQVKLPSGISVNARTVDMHVSNLRRKISASLYTISSIRGTGYRFMIAEKKSGKARKKKQ